MKSKKNEFGDINDNSYCADAHYHGVFQVAKRIDEMGLLCQYGDVPIGPIGFSKAFGNKAVPLLSMGALGTGFFVWGDGKRLFVTLGV